MNSFEQPNNPIRGARRFENEGGLNSIIYNIENWPGWLEKELITPKTITGQTEVRNYVEPGMLFLEKYFSKFLPPHKLFFSPNTAGEKTKALLYATEVIPVSVATNFDLKEQKYQELSDFLNESCLAFESSYDQNTHNGEAPELLAKSLMFGKTIGNEKPKLYLVDMYPTIKCTGDRFEELVKSLTAQLGPETSQFLTESITKAGLIAKKYL